GLTGIGAPPPALPERRCPDAAGACGPSLGFAAGERRPAVARRVRDERARLLTARGPVGMSEDPPSRA
ncbi:MAG: hypothetical protein ACYCSI_13255, partial [Solirubrobacteraceae bacterium]